MRFCQEHAVSVSRGMDAQRRFEKGTTTERGYGAAWRKLRLLVLQRDAVCAVAGCTRPSVIADHILPKEQGGSDDMSNLQGMCQPCHDRKRATTDKIKNMAVTK